MNDYENFGRVGFYARGIDLILGLRDLVGSRFDKRCKEDTKLRYYC